MPRVRWSRTPASAPARLRTSSTHGPAAFTTTPLRAWSARPVSVSRSATSPPAISVASTWLAHQADIALLEVAHAAVDQLRAAARGARGPVEAFDERDPEPAQRRIARHAGARNAAADDEEIERGGGKGGEGRLARLGGERRGHRGRRVRLSRCAQLG